MSTFAIDPGPHTGICYDAEYAGFQSMTLDFQLIPKPHRKLYTWLVDTVNPDRDQIVLERFEYRKDDAQLRSYIDYSPGEYVGVVKLFCDLTGTELFLQGASEAKSGFWGNDAKVKKVGMRWGTKHERDAIKHWLYHKTFTVHDQTWLLKLK